MATAGGRIMYINIDFRLNEELQEQIKQETIKQATEMLLQNPNELRSMIKECVKGQLKAIITEILQGKDYRNFLRDKIAKEIGVE